MFSITPLTITAISLLTGSYVAAISVGDALSIQGREVLAVYTTYAQQKATYSKRGAYNARDVLSKRIPEDHGCYEGGHWLQRRCRPDLDDRTYQDTCKVISTGRIYRRPGSCLENTRCENVEEMKDGKTEENIMCVPATPRIWDKVTAKDGQIGLRVVQQSIDGETDVAIHLMTNLVGASVFAFVMDSTMSYPVAPNYAFNGNLRGHRKKLCSQPINSYECVPVPSTNFDFTKGEIVDFTFGVLAFQKLTFLYHIG